MKYKGFWETPNSKANHHYGELVIDKNNNILLTLFSKYSEEEIEKEVYVRLSTLFGTTTDGKKITLSNAFSTKGRGSSVYKRIIKYKLCLIGEHREIEKELIDEFKVEYSNLLGFFPVEDSNLNEKNSKNSIDKKIYSSAGLEISFNAWIKQSSNSNSSRIPTKKIAYFKIKKSEPIKIFKLINEVIYLQMLLVILSQRPVFVVKFYIPKLEQRFKGVKEESELYLNDNSYSTRKDSSKIEIINLWQQINQKLGEIISLWLINEENWRSILELTLNGVFNKPNNHTSQFLNIITAVESWHRINNDTYDEESLKNYEILKNQIQNKELKCWFSSRQMNLTLLSLPKRLKVMCEEDILNLFKDKKSFISKCVTQRNNIAHNLLEKRKPANYLEIYIMSLILKLLLEQSILRKLKINDEDIKQILFKSDTYKRLENVRYLNPEILM